MICLGEKAKTLPANLKKRFSKRRTALKKCNKSGTSTREVEKVKKEYEEYKFLFWLEPYIQNRGVTMNVPEIGENADAYACDEGEFSNEEIQNTESQ